MRRSMKIISLAIMIPTGIWAQDRFPTGEINYIPKLRTTRSTQNVLRALQVKRKLELKTEQSKLIQHTKVVDGVDPVIVAKELMNTGAFEYAEADYMEFPVEFVPNDSQVKDQWHHEKIGSYKAWEYTQGEGVKVAVCDSGVDASHPDLKNNLILPGYNIVDGSRNSGAKTTHGTRVAGYIAAQGNNKIGVAGVAYKAKIIPMRVTNSSRGGASTRTLANCIRLGADKGAKIINVSYTGAGSSTINTAAKYARAKGSLVFYAGGNAGKNKSSDPDWSSFVIVGATTSSDKRSSFSNYGTPIDITGPGSSVRSTTPGGGYKSSNGTSFSSPIVAGVGALLASLKPDITPDEIEKYLYAGADNIGKEFYFGAGRVNAYKSVQLLADDLSLGMSYQVLAKLNGKSVEDVNVQLDEIVEFDGSENISERITDIFWEIDGEVYEGALAQVSFDTPGVKKAELIVVLDDGNISTKDFSITVVTQKEFYVSKIRMSVSYGLRSSTGKARVYLQDAEGNIVKNVRIYGSWGDGKKTVVNLRKADYATFISNRKSRRYLHKFQVDRIEHETLFYNDKKNKETSDSIRVR